MKQKQVCGVFTFLYCFIINDVAKTVTYNSSLIYHQKNTRNIKKIKTLESGEVFSKSGVVNNQNKCHSWNKVMCRGVKCHSESPWMSMSQNSNRKTLMTTNPWRGYKQANYNINETGQETPPS